MRIVFVSATLTAAESAKKKFLIKKWACTPCMLLALTYTGEIYLQKLTDKIQEQHGWGNTREWGTFQRK